MNAFLPADILFPQVDSMEKWAVIACDQFTSDPAYWERVRQACRGFSLDDQPYSARGRAWYPAGGCAHGRSSTATMAEYLDANVFTVYR